MKLSFQSALLLLTAVLLAFALQTAHLPAAWLFGPLVASALFAVADWQAVEFPRPVYLNSPNRYWHSSGRGFFACHVTNIAHAFYYLRLRSGFHSADQSA
jgi:uncharacterized membrane protein AbrB (regulator of aidB expression)